MAAEFAFDVFLSHSSRDKAIVRELAERLRKDGLKVWFDEKGDSTPAKVEEGLERSRVMVLCMPVNAFGSDWTQLEAGTFRFRDPLNKDRRFIPLRLDDRPSRARWRNSFAIRDVGAVADDFHLSDWWARRFHQSGKARLDVERPAWTSILAERPFDLRRPAKRRGSELHLYDS